MVVQVCIDGSIGKTEEIGLGFNERTEWDVETIFGFYGIELVQIIDGDWHMLIVND